LGIFSELVLKRQGSRLYGALAAEAVSEIVIAAVHGGGIEPLTSEVAAAIAGDEHSLYDFQGARASNNEELCVITHFTLRRDAPAYTNGTISGVPEHRGRRRK
jgi:phage replication-related protein YjqB (UPF0714/DUF867 family)